MHKMSFTEALILKIFRGGAPEPPVCQGGIPFPPNPLEGLPQKTTQTPTRQVGVPSPKSAPNATRPCYTTDTF